ncbi:sensor histidine kinase [Leptolyngbyaceae cyanobacterium CCMR0082]|uniref:histidine kinase n=2 Tax=Adonisia turfae TaxID=2950184 RepID=A0A6M0RYC9_9CYAN|nr:HAMP domain-containing sensor histidine kinase [Adonisia turfae]MDV3351920.1 HAMP domain-containing sensor histidine kinase [Leptothoe sp. LEGE 181152]NEZ57770.1 sensor histidine kinase [Adonisia turfae CCMR0081]NEZ61218.1 sensor histidine kinase [Adonisia turfae CCMR0082]
MAKVPTNISLRTRLLLSHLIVMAVAIIALAGVSRLSTPRYFVVTLERLEGRGIRIQQVRGQILESFTDAWARGMVWSVLLGGGAAGGISYLLSRRIIRPLTRMEGITQRFAAGDWAARVPPSDIPELHQLGHSFNRMASELEQVEQQRRDLVSDLSHELRTPLTILRGYLEALSDQKLPATPKTYAKLMGETQRLQRLVEDLQELSKLEAGYLPIQRQSTDLTALTEQVTQRFLDQQLASDKPQIVVDTTPDLPAVEADPARTEQVLVNLLSNALKYTEIGQITVKTWQNESQVWLAVQDTGIGIAAADLPHVFERFWRADRSRSRGSGGTGIGLAICKRLVELQGGEIYVSSEVNRGSTFEFWLPKATQTR